MSQAKYNDDDGKLHQATKKAAKAAGQLHCHWVREALIKALPATERKEFKS